MMAEVLEARGQELMPPQTLQSVRMKMWWVRGCACGCGRPRRSCQTAMANAVDDGLGLGQAKQASGTGLAGCRWTADDE